MTQTIDSTEASPSAVLRLLNGALRGAEFVLEAGTTLIVARAPQALGGGAGQAEFPDNAIFVPVDGEGGNFEVDIVAQPDGTPGIALRDLGSVAEAEADADAEAAYTPNTVRRIAGLDIALRARDEAWSDAVRNYGVKAPAAAEVLDAAVPPSQKNVRRGAKTWRIAGPALLAILLAGAAGAMWWMQPGTQRGADTAATAAALAAVQKSRMAQAAQLSLALRGDGRYRVLPGRDGQMYVFAADEREAAWARQSVARSEDTGNGKKISVLRKADESARIERLLDGLSPAPAYHMVRLGDPAAPEIWLSRERAPLTAAACQALAQKMTALLPYAARVEIRWIADAAIAQQAEAGLERLGVQHKKIDNGASVTMSIRGALPDGELQKLRSYVESFYRQWGTHYVHYDVELADDVRKGKSFEYGGESYIKSSASHWDFSSQI
ncbi:PrgH/EprH family type III secretion apparatus protein [Oxalobacteraceae bacterium CAVE-383]|nr:PrgH/EprH family type III secretion apparatus protein [Oxalobacteraceae bacterium CAVE-383]